MSRRDSVSPVARGIPFDNSTNGFDSDITQDAIEENRDLISNSASPGFTWGKGGSSGPGDFLINDDVESNKSGRAVPFDGFLTKIFANNIEDSGSRALEIVRRRPCQTGSYVAIGEITLTNGNPCGSADLNIAILEDDELAIRVKSGSSDWTDTSVGILISNNSGTGQVGGKFLQTENEGSLIEPTTTKYNFTGSGIAATSDGLGNVTVQFSGGGTPFSAGSVNGDGSTNSIINAAVARTATGRYTVTFVSVAASDNYPILITLEQNSGTDDYGATYTNVATTGFDVEIKEQDDDGGGGTFRDSGFSFLIPNTGAAQPAGESNTASNIGAGDGLFAQKTGVDLEFKSLVAGPNVSLISSPTEVTISATDGGEDNTASNLSGDEGVFSSKLGVDLQFKSLNAGTNITLSSDANSITIDAAGSPAGENNTASNIGAGDGLFAQKTGVDLEFKSLVAGSNITITPSTSTLTIDAVSSGEANSGNNVGTGADVFRDKTGLNLNLRGINGTNGISAAVNGDNIDVSLDSPPDLDVNKVTSAIEVAGGQNLTAGYVDVTLDTTALESTSIATHTPGSADIVIVKTGLYMVNYGLMIEQICGNNRTQAAMRLQVNSTTVAGSAAELYSRNTSTGGNSASKSFPLLLTSGDTVTVQATRTSGSGSIGSLPDGPFLNVQYLRSGN